MNAAVVVVHPLSPQCCSSLAGTLVVLEGMVNSLLPWCCVELRGCVVGIRGQKDVLRYHSPAFRNLHAFVQFLPIPKFINS